MPMNIESIRVHAVMPLIVLAIACGDEPRALRAQGTSPESVLPGNGAQYLKGLIAAESDSARQISQYISAIVQDRAGTLWFGTVFDGVYRYDGRTFTHYTAADGLAEGPVRSILEDSAGALWFSARGGVSRYDGVRFTTYAVRDGARKENVTDLARGRDGALWVATDRGPMLFDGSDFSSIVLPFDSTLRDFPTGNRSPRLVWSIIEDRAGALWFGTNGSGVIRYDGTTLTQLTTRDGLVDDFVFALHEDRSGTIWLGTNGGVSRYDDKGFTSYTTADGLANHDVWCILEDRAGTLWFGTGGGGASRFDGRTFTTISKEQGLANGHVQSLLEDRDGRLWMGTSGGLYRFDGERAVNITRD